MLYLASLHERLITNHWKGADVNVSFTVPSVSLRLSITARFTHRRLWPACASHTPSHTASCNLPVWSLLSADVVCATCADMLPIHLSATSCPVPSLFLLSHFTVYLNTTGCSEPLGIKSRLIDDRQLTASSTFRTWGIESFTWHPHYARLDKQGKTNAWTAATNNPSEWLQVRWQTCKAVKWQSLQIFTFTVMCDIWSEALTESSYILQLL